MRHTLIGQLPHHKYVYVDTNHTHKSPKGFLPAVWFGLVAYPGRCWGCSVLFENGAVYRNLPPHALAFDPDAQLIWSPQDAQTWDCYGWDFTVIEYDYLRGLDVLVRTKLKQCHEGEYLFTAAPVGDAYSAAPDQSKEFSFIRLDNGRLTIQPTNNVLFRERSFTTTDLTEFPTELKKQTDLWTTE